MEWRAGRWRIVAAALLACAAATHAQQSSAAAVYASIAPAVVFVETDSGTGSGLLLESDAILTAAHVVYPHRSARVVFPDGTELLDVPLIGWDLMADIAVLGPVQSEVAPPPLATTAEPAVGSDLFTIGYPGEVEPFPQPTISRGILSRYRRWPDQGITYLQTDASVDGGQSGGVLASSGGTFLGMTVFTFGHFGLAISAADLLSRVDALLAGEDPAGLGDRTWDQPQEAGPIRVRLRNYWSKHAFVIHAQPGETMTATAHGGYAVFLKIVDIGGETIAEGDDTAAQDPGSVTATLDGTPPFLLTVAHLSDDSAYVLVDADVKLTRVIDPDDGAFLQVPARRVAALDYPYDVDHFHVRLRADEPVRIRVDSTAVNPYVSVDYAGSRDWVSDDDSGGGVFGTSAELVYRADFDRTYRLVVDDAYGDHMGGYTLAIETVES